MVGLERTPLSPANVNRRPAGFCLQTARIQGFARRRCRQRLRDHDRHARVETRKPISAAPTAIVRIPTAIGPDAWWIQNSIRLSSLEKRSAVDRLTRLAS